jgi:exopolysaccharide production protein ExoZ
MNASKVAETGILQPAAVPSVIWLLSVGLLALSVRHNEFLHLKFGRRAKAIRFGGLLTYPLYLVHEPVAYFLIYAMTLAHVRASVAWLISLVAAFYVAYLVTKHAEPWLKGKTRDAIDRLHGKFVAGR